MTEDEAKTKWCPFVRLHMEQDGESATNRDRFVLPETEDSQTSPDRVRHNARCISSVCMAWRETDSEPIWPEDDDFQENNPERNIRQTGYCGLAGKP